MKAPTIIPDWLLATLPRETAARPNSAAIPQGDIQSRKSMIASYTALNSDEHLSKFLELPNFLAKQSSYRLASTIERRFTSRGYKQENTLKSIIPSARSCRNYVLFVYP